LSDSFPVQDWTGTGQIGDLAEVYNRQIAGSVPHCYPLSAQEFGAGRYQRTGDDYTAALHDERILVGIQGGTLHGYAHVTVGEIAHRDHRLTGGFVHFFTYQVGHGDVGQALLEACEHHVSESDASTIRAFDGYFYRFHHLGFPLLSDRMAHVYSLFGMNGYKLVGEGEIF
jgi:hypothetical protein